MVYAMFECVITFFHFAAVVQDSPARESSNKIDVEVSLLQLRVADSSK